MSKPEIIRSRPLGSSDVASDVEAPVRATAAVVRLSDFRPQRRERIYDSDKIWSGEHTARDYTEL
ncbi:conserved hypothetical protein [Bradyrhizobium sp. ORS 375]|uniref:hypothetical protein n=1 Tax=Bradyrhizobium sp. (strain ORS 375) TaxID=566679 RepID=UPI00024062C8|nr:hypothetical protein [Bradyrhizobium sp. ORS 375]CCD90695.1 conserved hypothetical protein [Bradyrhizobium sp. ORS 375]